MRAAWRRAWDYKGAVPAEVALNTWWRGRYADATATPAFPFWLSAILDECRTRKDLRDEVSRWRKRATRLRASRAAFEQALLHGDVGRIEPYENAMAGAVDRLAEANLSAGLATAAKGTVQSSLALTGIPSFLSDAVATVVDDEVRRLLKPSTSWLLRITRPRLWFLARATAAGQRLVEPQFKLASLFALPPGDKAHGLDFLSRVNAVEWAI
jgi:hypothetical protein